MQILQSSSSIQRLFQLALFAVIFCVVGWIWALIHNVRRRDGQDSWYDVGSVTFLLGILCHSYLMIAAWKNQTKRLLYAPVRAMILITQILLVLSFVYEVYLGYRIKNTFMIGSAILKALLWVVIVILTYEHFVVIGVEEAERQDTSASSPSTDSNDEIADEDNII
jgi:hypothetical protein